MTGKLYDLFFSWKERKIVYTIVFFLIGIFSFSSVKSQSSNYYQLLDNSLENLSKENLKHIRIPLDDTGDTEDEPNSGVQPTSNPAGARPVRNVPRPNNAELIDNMNSFRKGNTWDSQLRKVVKQCCFDNPIAIIDAIKAWTLTQGPTSSSPPTEAYIAMRRILMSAFEEMIGNNMGFSTQFWVNFITRLVVYPEIVGGEVRLEVLQQIWSANAKAQGFTPEKYGGSGPYAIGAWMSSEFMAWMRRNNNWKNILHDLIEQMLGSAVFEFTPDAMIPGGNTSGVQAFNSIQYFLYRVASLEADAHRTQSSSPTDWISDDPSNCYFSYHEIFVDMFQNMMQNFWVYTLRLFNGDPLPDNAQGMGGLPFVMRNFFTDFIMQQQDWLQPPEGMDVPKTLHQFCSASLKSSLLQLKPRPPDSRRPNHGQMIAAMFGTDRPVTPREQTPAVLYDLFCPPGRYKKPDYMNGNITKGHKPIESVKIWQRYIQSLISAQLQAVFTDALLIPDVAFWFASPWGRTRGTEDIHQYPGVSLLDRQLILRALASAGEINQYGTEFVITYVSRALAHFLMTQRNTVVWGALMLWWESLRAEYDTGVGDVQVFEMNDIMLENFLISLYSRLIRQHVLTLSRRGHLGDAYNLNQITNQFIRLGHDIHQRLENDLAHEEAAEAITREEANRIRSQWRDMIRNASDIDRFRAGYNTGATPEQIQMLAQPRQNFWVNQQIYYVNMPRSNQVGEDSQQAWRMHVQTGDWVRVPSEDRINAVVNQAQGNVTGQTQDLMPPNPTPNPAAPDVIIDQRFIMQIEQGGIQLNPKLRQLISQLPENVQRDLAEMLGNKEAKPFFPSNGQPRAGQARAGWDGGRSAMNTNNQGAVDANANGLNRSLLPSDEAGPGAGGGAGGAGGGGGAGGAGGAGVEGGAGGGQAGAAADVVAAAEAEDVLADVATIAASEVIVGMIGLFVEIGIGILMAVGIFIWTLVYTLNQEDVYNMSNSAADMALWLCYYNFKFGNVQVDGLPGEKKYQISKFRNINIYSRCPGFMIHLIKPSNAGAMDPTTADSITFGNNVDSIPPYRDGMVGLTTFKNTEFVFDCCDSKNDYDNGDSIWTARKTAWANDMKDSHNGLHGHSGGDSREINRKLNKSMLINGYVYNKPPMYVPSEGDTIREDTALERKEFLKIKYWTEDFCKSLLSPLDSGKHYDDEEFKDNYYSSLDSMMYWHLSMSMNLKGTYLWDYHSNNAAFMELLWNKYSKSASDDDKFWVFRFDKKEWDIDGDPVDYHFKNGSRWIRKVLDMDKYSQKKWWFGDLKETYMSEWQTRMFYPGSPFATTDASPYSNPNPNPKKGIYERMKGFFLDKTPVNSDSTPIECTNDYGLAQWKVDHVALESVMTPLIYIADGGLCPDDAYPKCFSENRNDKLLMTDIGVEGVNKFYKFTAIHFPKGGFGTHITHYYIFYDVPIRNNSEIPVFGKTTVLDSIRSNWGNPDSCWHDITPYMLKRSSRACGYMLDGLIKWFAPSGTDTGPYEWTGMNEDIYNDWDGPASENIQNCPKHFFQFGGQLNSISQLMLMQPKTPYDMLTDSMTSVTHRLQFWAKQDTVNYYHIMYKSDTDSVWNVPNPFMPTWNDTITRSQRDTILVGTRQCISLLCKSLSIPEQDSIALHFCQDTLYTVDTTGRYPYDSCAYLAIPDTTIWWHRLDSISILKVAFGDTIQNWNDTTSADNLLNCELKFNFVSYSPQDAGDSYGDSYTPLPMKDYSNGKNTIVTPIFTNSTAKDAGSIYFLKDKKNKITKNLGQVVVQPNLQEYGLSIIGHIRYFSSTDNKIHRVNVMMDVDDFMGSQYEGVARPDIEPVPPHPQEEEKEKDN